MPNLDIKALNKIPITEYWKYTEQLNNAVNLDGENVIHEKWKIINENLINLYSEALELIIQRINNTLNKYPEIIGCMVAIIYTNSDLTKTLQPNYAGFKVAYPYVILKNTDLNVKSIKDLPKIDFVELENNDLKKELADIYDDFRALPNILLRTMGKTSLTLFLKDGRIRVDYL